MSNLNGTEADLGRIVSWSNVCDKCSKNKMFKGIFRQIDKEK
jgi:hypothetical protein